MSFPRTRTAVRRPSGHAATRTTAQGNGVDPPDANLHPGGRLPAGCVTKALHFKGRVGRGWCGFAGIPSTTGAYALNTIPTPAPPLEGEGKEHCGFSGQQCAFAGMTDRDDLFRPSLKRLRHLRAAPGQEVG